MIERQIVTQKIKEEAIASYVMNFLGRLSCSRVALQRTPLGEKVIVHTSKPGLIVGKKGANIKELTRALKDEFKLENPQIEVAEIENANLDSASVAKSLVAGFERFGSKRFKAMTYKALENVMHAGALGVEIVVGGRGIPSTRAKTWRFMTGYLKKSGDISENFVDRAHESCNLKSGTIGIKVSILKPDVRLPDKIFSKEKIDKTITVKEENTPIEEKLVVEELKEEITTEEVKKEEPIKKKRAPRKGKEVKENGEDKKE